MNSFYQVMIGLFLVGLFVGIAVAHLRYSILFKRFNDLREKDALVAKSQTRAAALAEFEANRETQNAMQAEDARMYMQMKDQTDIIALFLRENYKREIEQGYHAQRGLGQIVVGYLAREREIVNSASPRSVAAYADAHLTSEQIADICRRSDAEYAARSAQRSVDAAAATARLQQVASEIKEKGESQK